MKSLLSFFMVVLVLSTAGLAAASPAVDAALKRLGQPGSEQVRAAVEELGNEGSPRALELLAALEERQLQRDEAGSVFIVPASGVPVAMSGSPQKGRLSAIALDNSIRRSLDAALARLRLTSADVAQRLVAATRLADEPEEAQRPLLKSRVDVEPDGAVRERLRLALARLDLNSERAEVRASAVSTLGAIADVGTRSELERVARLDTEARVRALAVEALAAVDSRLFRLNLLANAIYGLSLGSVLLLAALGLAITFGLLRVINMAHGELLMLGAYATWLSQSALQRYAPAYVDWYLLLALPAAFCLPAIVGMALERLVVSRLYGRPLETLLATWGLSLILVQTVRLVFGAQNVSVENPRWLSGGWALLPSLVIPYSRLAVMAFTAAVVTLVWLVLSRTSLGLRVRAVTQNREMAAALGIPTARIDMWTFGLGSGVAGLGGLALSQLGNVGPELGQQHIIDSFMVVVVGGVGNLAGAVIGAMALGLVNKLLEPSTGAVLGKILVLALLIAFIQWRPQGIFALKGRAAESA